MVAKVVSKSPSLLTFKKRSSNPIVAAASARAFDRASVSATSGLLRTATRETRGTRLMQQFESFRVHRAREQAHTCDIAARPVDAGHKAGFDWIAAIHEHDRCNRGCRL